MPDGGVQLAEYVRPARDSLAHLNTRTPVISSVTLDRRELAAFAPERQTAGARWTLPDDVARKLARITSPLCYQHAPQPEWVTAVRITAEVLSVSDATTRLRYEGRIASEHRVRGRIISLQEASLVGEGVYASGAEAMRSVLLVGSGSLRWPEAPEKLVTFDLLVEWDREAD